MRRGKGGGSAKVREKERAVEADVSSRSAKEEAMLPKSNKMPGKRGIGRRAGTMTGLGKSLQKSPMLVRAKARKARKEKEQESGARMEKVMARITLRIPPRRIPTPPFPQSSLLQETLSLLCRTFPVSSRLRERKRTLQFLEISQNRFSWQLRMVMSYLTHALTPTSMVMDLGCTRAMTSWRAAKDLMEFCDKNPECGLWYQLDQTTSLFLSFSFERGE